MEHRWSMVGASMEHGRSMVSVKQHAQNNVNMIKIVKFSKFNGSKTVYGRRLGLVSFGLNGRITDHVPSTTGK